MSNKFLDDAGVIYLFSKVKERDYQSDFELGYYDTITENDDESYTITRQTGYIVLDGVKHKFDGKQAVNSNSIFIYTDDYFKSLITLPTGSSTLTDIICNRFETKTCDYLYSNNTYGIGIHMNGGIWVGLTTSIKSLTDANAYLVQNPISIQYKLKTATTEKVEANHYARYNQRFILDHNKSEAERSCNLYSGVQTCSGNDTRTDFRPKFQAYDNNNTIILSSGLDPLTSTNKIVSFTFNKTSDMNRIRFGHNGSANDILLYYDVTNLPNRTYTLSFLVTGYTGTQSFTNIMLNEGTVALPYQPYEGKVVHEKELVDNYITETEINDKLYNYLKVNENGSVLLSSGPLQIFYTDIDFSIYSEQRPNNIINSGDLDVYFFDTGITCRDYEADVYYKYSFPAKSGTFAMTSDIPSALAIDSELSSTSTNSVQNKVINSALDGKANKTDITDMTYVVDSSDNAVSLETYGTGGYYVVPTKTYVDTQLTDKQDKLVSGTNIKTINGSTILGSGDITISGGSGGNVGTDPSFNSVIVEQTGAENTGVKLYANRQGDLYSIKRADTSVNRKILTNSDIDPSKVVLTYGITQLYQHHYELEAQPSGDTIYVTCWSTQNTKILLKDITRYAFSNVQVYNSTNDETIQVIKWSSSGFRYINDTGNIDSNGYTVTHYYINGEPTTY